MCPRWWITLVIVVGIIYAAFAVAITYQSWDAKTGVTGPFATWRLFRWAFRIGGGAIGAVAVLVFSHAIGVLQPMSCRPLQLPPVPEQPTVAGWASE